MRACNATLLRVALHYAAELGQFQPLLPHAFTGSGSAQHYTTILWQLCLQLRSATLLPLLSEVCCSVPAPAGCPAPSFDHSLQRSGCSQCAKR
jgi:hypothetical protein